MKGEIVRTRTVDGLSLDGLWSEPRAHVKGTAYLHLHGFAGNFYGSQFVDEIAREVTARGHAFLTANTRGHDCVTESHQATANGGRYVTLGSAHERFEDCLFDIRAWLDVLDSRGYQRIALSGHSAGALKAAYYQSTQEDESVETLVFLAPPDVVGQQKAAFGSRMAADLALAGEWVAAGHGNRLMPAESSSYPVSARTYLSYLGPGSRAGVFNFHDPTDTFDVVGRIRQPILACMGSADRTVVVNVATCLATLQARAMSAPLCETVLLAGASHTFVGFERELAQAVGGWLDRVFTEEAVRWAK